MNTEEEHNESQKKAVPLHKLSGAPLNIRDFDTETEERIDRVTDELREGMQFIRNHPKTVTFFGSARFDENNPHYMVARELAGRLSALGYAVVTGGGPGIMEAANRGASEHDGNEHSLGMTIKLPHEQTTNPYVTDYVDFHYFFTRKVMLAFSAEAYVYFPGGYGTLDEFFEIVTLVQTHKIERLPIICMGTDFWEPLRGWIKEHVLQDHQAINPNDLFLYTITDDIDQVVEICRTAPMRNE
jgi:hypothetical protein